jgi:hypothetical protein
MLTASIVACYKYPATDKRCSFESQTLTCSLENFLCLKTTPKNFANMDQRLPKRPRTAYILYCKEKWPNVQAALGTTDSKKVIPVLARAWKDLSAEDRNKYHDMSNQERRAREGRGGGPSA